MIEERNGYRNDNSVWKGYTAKYSEQGNQVQKNKENLFVDLILIYCSKSQSENDPQRSVSSMQKVNSYNSQVIFIKKNPMIFRKQSLKIDHLYKYSVQWNCFR